MCHLCSGGGWDGRYGKPESETAFEGLKSHVFPYRKDSVPFLRALRRHRPENRTRTAVPYQRCGTRLPLRGEGHRVL